MRKKVYVELVSREAIENVAKIIGEQSAAASCLRDAVKLKNPIFYRWQGLLGVCEKSDIKIEGEEYDNNY